MGSLSRIGLHVAPNEELSRLRAITEVRPHEITGADKTAILALSFPELAKRAAHAILPFDALLLNKWARSGAPGHGGACAARFVLSVWDPGTKLSCGRFNMHEALQTWDDEHRKAFITWIQNPWWP